MKVFIQTIDNEAFSFDNVTTVNTYGGNFVYIAVKNPDGSTEYHQVSEGIIKRLSQYNEAESVDAEAETVG